MSQDNTNVNTCWEYNGLKLTLDVQDADTMDVYEAAFEAMRKKELNVPKDGLKSAYIRTYHRLFVELFDDLFGEGTGVQLVGEKANSLACNECYESFLLFVRQQVNANAQFMSALEGRYSPNRAARRAVQKGGKK